MFLGAFSDSFIALLKSPARQDGKSCQRFAGAAPGCVSTSHVLNRLVRFRPGLRGKNFSIRVVRRLKGKQSPSGKAIKLGKHYRLNSRELHCSKSLAAVAAIPGASPSDPMALASGVVVRKLLRAACLEVLLVEMYGEVEYFSVMAVAFRRRDSPAQLSVQCMCVRA